MSKYGRKAVTLAGVLAVALVGATAIGLWAGAAGPASTDAALDDPAVTMDHDAGICIGDPLKDADSADAPFYYCANGCTAPPGCKRLSCEPCCWRCGSVFACN